MGWVSGCAWTDAIVFWSPLDRYPSAAVCAKDVGLAMGLNCLAYAWLVGTAGKAASIDDAARRDRKKIQRDSILALNLSPSPSPTPRNDREKIERYFLNNALSFVVGWGWVTVLRGLATLFADNVCNAPTETVWNTLGQAGMVFIFGPVLTLLLVKSKSESLFTMLWVCKPSNEPTPSLQPLNAHSTRSSVRSTVVDTTGEHEHDAGPTPEAVPMESARAPFSDVEDVRDAHHGHSDRSSGTAQARAPHTRAYSSHVAIEARGGGRNAVLAGRLRSHRRALQVQVHMLAAEPSAAVRPRAASE